MSQYVVVFVADCIALPAVSEAHPLAPVSTAQLRCPHVEILVDFGDVVCLRRCHVLRGACKLRLEGFFRASCFLRVKFRNQLLELNTRDEFIPAKELTVCVQICRCNCHVHEAVVGVKPLNAVAPVRVFPDGSHACS